MQKSFLFSVLAAASVVAVIPTSTQASSVLNSGGLTGVASPTVSQAHYVVRRRLPVRVYQERNYRGGRYYGPGSGTGVGQTYTGPGSGSGLGRSTYTGAGSGTGLGRY